MGFIRVANAELTACGRPERFGTTAIVACVFELEQLIETAKQLGLSDDAIALACAIPLRIVKSAFEHFRLCYTHADKIWKHCLAVSQERSVRLEWLTNNPTKFIKTKVTPSSRASIKKGDGGYVYEREDLSHAPAAGHPWAIS